jgi:hypothetical protein
MINPDYLNVLKENAALPDDRLAVFVAGSLIRGWGNDRSDLDVYVVTGQPWQGERESEIRVWADPGAVPVRAFYAGNRRWDVEYWLDRQVESLVDYASWDKFETGESKASVLTTAEVSLAHRIGTCEIAEGPGWIERRRAQFGTSAIKNMVAAYLLDRLDSLTEDAVGMAAAGDSVSAVIAARRAYAFAVDAFVASRGEFEMQPKWQARRLLATGAAELRFDEYWEIETMRNYDPGNPNAWIEDVLRRCQRLADAVEL